MKYWRINTDNKSRKDIQTCDLWYQFGLAFTGDYVENKLEHAKVFTKLSIGDGIFMHHSGLGVVGYGLVQETWDGVIYDGTKKLLYVDEKAKELYEYRIKVAWENKDDCRKNPVGIYNRLPYEGTYSYVDIEKWNVNAVLRDLERNNLLTI